MASSSSGQRKASIVMSAVRALRERLGDSGMEELKGVINDAGKQWKDDVLAVAAERFEHRLVQEMAAMRVDMAKESAALRTDMAKEFAAVRTEMARDLGRVENNLLKWSFLFWIGQVAAIAAIGSFVIRSLR
jgi:hypothetical protein